MGDRRLYIAAYDISSNKRLRRALEILKRFASGGQKSVFECYLSDGERRHLLRDLMEILDEDEDRFFLVAVAHGDAETVALGIAEPPCDPDYFYVG